MISYRAVILLMILSFAFTGAVTAPASGDATFHSSDFWIPYGDVHAVADDDESFYIGGDFRHVGRPTGSFGTVDILTGRSVQNWPVIEGAVNAAAPDGKGGWFLGGEFVEIGGEEVSYVAHLLADGTLNPAWADAEPYSSVQALVVDDERVYVAGQRLQALSREDGKVDPSWTPSRELVVAALAMDDERIYTQIEDSRRGQTVIALSRDDGAIIWEQRRSSGYGSIYNRYDPIVAGGGKVYLGGTSLEAFWAETGEPVESWDPPRLVQSFDHEVNDGIYALAFDGDRLYAGGNFYLYEELQPARLHSEHGYELEPPSYHRPPPPVNLAAFSAEDGTIDDDFRVTLSGSVTALAILDDVIYTGGDFRFIDGESRPGLAAFSTRNAELIQEWDSGVMRIKPVQRDQRRTKIRTLMIGPISIAVGGFFDSLGGEVREGLAAISKSDASLREHGGREGVRGAIKSMIARDGRLYVGGAFKTTHGGATENLASFATEDGRLIRDWNPEGVDGPVEVLEADDERLYVGGSFSRAGAVRISNLAAFSLQDGEVLPTWNPRGVASTVRAMAIDSCRLYIGGRFSRAGGEDRQNLAALSKAEGLLIEEWTPARPNNAVTSLAIAGNQLLVGGLFSHIDEREEQSLVKLNLQDGSFVEPGLEWSTVAENHLLRIRRFGRHLYARHPGSLVVTDDAVYMSVVSRSPHRTSRDFWSTSAVDRESGEFLPDHELTNQRSTRLFSGGFAWTIGAEAMPRKLGPISPRPAQSCPTVDPPQRVAHPDLFTPGHEDEILDGRWLPFGEVKARTEYGDRTYMAGDFEYVGPHTGSFATLGVTDAKPDGQWPSVKGTIKAIVPDGEGGWFIGGEITAVDDVAVQNLARLRNDVSLDTEWTSAGVPGPIHALAIDEDRLYVGSDKLQAFSLQDASLDEDWPAARPDGPVHALLVDEDRLYVGGSFSSIGETRRDNLAALHRSSGRPVEEWTFTSFVGPVHAIVANQDSIFAAGIGGQSSRHPNRSENERDRAIVGLQKSDGRRKPGWVNYWNLKAAIYALAIDGDRLYLGGHHGASFRGLSSELIRHPPLAAISAVDGATDTEWSASSVDQPVHSLALADGRLYVGGHLRAISPTTGDPIESWNPPKANGSALAIAIQGERVAIGGDMTSTGGIPAPGLAAFTRESESYIANWNPEPIERPINALAADEDRLYVGGRELRALSRRDGRLLKNWDVTVTHHGYDDPLPHTDDHYDYLRQKRVTALATDGEFLYLGGYFSHVAGHPRQGLAALHLDDTRIVDGWNPKLTHYECEGHDGERCYATPYRVDSITISGNRLRIDGQYTQINDEYGDTVDTP